MVHATVSHVLSTYITVRGSRDQGIPQLQWIRKEEAEAIVLCTHFRQWILTLEEKRTPCLVFRLFLLSETISDFSSKLVCFWGRAPLSHPLLIFSFSYTSVGSSISLAFYGMKRILKLDSNCHPYNLGWVVVPIGWG